LKSAPKVSQTVLTDLWLISHLTRLTGTQTTVPQQYLDFWISKFSQLLICQRM